MRKQSLIFSVVLLAALVLSACGPASVSYNGAPPARTLNVNGVGQVSLTPDIAYIYIGVHTEAPTADQAVLENNTQTATVIQALKDAGIEAKDIRTSNFAIWPMDKYDPLTGTPTGEKSYSVDNTVYVTVRDLAELGTILDDVIAAGANTINSIQFDVDDKTEALKQAREAAVKNAREQAEELAGYAGVDLGAIQNISFYDSIPMPILDAYGKGGGGVAAEASVPIQPGEMTLQVTVNITYEIK
jgi:uncharacterized protein YggE